MRQTYLPRADGVYLPSPQAHTHTPNTRPWAGQPPAAPTDAIRVHFKLTTSTTTTTTIVTLDVPQDLFYAAAAFHLVSRSISPYSPRQSPLGVPRQACARASSVVHT